MGVLIISVGAHFSHCGWPSTHKSIQIDTHVSNVLSKTLPYITTFGSVSALSLETTSKNIQTYTHIYIQNMPGAPLLSIVWLRFCTFGARHPSKKHGHKICAFSYVTEKLQPSREKLRRVQLRFRLRGRTFDSGSGQNAPGSAPVRIPAQTN